MFSLLQSAMVVIAGMLGTALAIWIVNRLWKTSERKLFNDVIGWQFGVLGTTYAVILGFMLSSVWGNYTVAASDVTDEAIANLGVFRSAENLPKPFSDEMRDLAIRYARAVLDGEWPAMASERDPVQGNLVIVDMWTLTRDMQKQVPPESNAATTVRAAIRLLQDKRERRMEQYRSHLPPIMWCVLICGAVLVIGCSCLSGNEKLLLHCFHVLSISFLILLMLMAVADLARPFEGGTSLDPAAFREIAVRMSKAVSPLSTEH